MNILLGFLIICIFLIMIIISNRVNYKFIKIYNIFIIVILSIIAYKYIPSKSMDLYRLFSVLEKTRMMGLDYLFKYSDYSSLPVASLFFYVISLFNNNHLLPFVACLIYYSTISFIIIDYAQKNNCSRLGLSLSLTMFYLSSNYLGVISEIRNPLAISLFVLFLYKDIQKKFKDYRFLIAYFILCFLHPSMLILFIIRLLLMLNKRYDKIICILLFLWTKLKSIILSILLLFGSNSFFSLITQKFTSYDEVEAYAVANVNLYTFVYCTIYILIIILFLLLKKRKNVKKYHNNNRMFAYYYCFCIGSIFEYHLFVRFSRLVVFLGLLIIIDLFSIEENKKNKLLYTIIILIESIAFLMFYLTGQYLILIN